MISTRFRPLLLGCGLLAAATSTAQASTRNYTALGADDVNGAGATNPGSEGYVALISQWIDAHAPSGWDCTRKPRAGVGFTTPTIALRDVDPNTSGTQTLVNQATSDKPIVITLWTGPQDVREIVSPQDYPGSSYNAVTGSTQTELFQNKLNYFSTHYTNILNQLVRIGGAKIVVANVPKLGTAYRNGFGPNPSTTELSKAGNLDSFSKLISDRINSIAAGYHVPVVDLYNDTTLGSDLLPNGTLNTAGHAKLAQLFESKLDVDGLFDTVVTTTADVIDPADGLTSLQEAVEIADRGDGTKTIRFQNGLTGTIGLNSSLPYLSDGMAIIGPGAANLTIQRTTTTPFSIFTVTNSSTHVGISGLTIKNGSAASGGGILNPGYLTLSDCVLNGNAATSGTGGGLYNNGTATIQNCVFSANTAKTGGGGISNDGTLTLENSVVNGNSVSGVPSAGGYGGGIRNSATLKLIQSVIQGNSALAADASTLGYGGGIANMSSAALSALSIQNSTIDNNTAEGRGGGLYNGAIGTSPISGSTFSNNHATGTTAGQGGAAYNNAGLLKFTNCTLAANSARQGGGLYLQSTVISLLQSTVAGNSATESGGGIFNNFGASAMWLQNSVLALNTTGQSDPDIAASMYLDSGYNLVGGNPGLVLDNNNRPLLADNGGPTRTIALAKGSAAVNAGDPAVAPNADTDQRGAGFVRVRGGRLDIGAFEVQNDAPVANDYKQVLEPGETSKSLLLTATDPEGDALTYSIVTPPAHGTLGAFNGNRVTYKPNGDFPGSDSFTFKVNDGYADSNIATAIVKYNSLPVLVSLLPATADGTASGSGGNSPADKPLKLALTVSDVDGADKLRLAYLTFNAGLSNANGLALSYDFSVNKLYLRSSDGKTTIGGQAPGSTGTVENDYGILDFANSTVVKNGDVATVTFYVTPKTSFTGAKKLWGKVRDNGNLEVGFNQMATWTVNPPAPPVSHVQALSFSEIIKPEETSHRLSLKALNPDNMLLKYIIVDQPLHGTVSNPSGTMVVYTPGADFAAVGVDTFTYKVNDGYADSNIATVTIKYNSAPTLVDLVPGKADGSVVGSGNVSVVGEPLKLVLTVSDEDGADKLRAAYVTFNKGLSNAGGIVLSYDVPSNKLYLRSTDGKTTIGGQAPGSAGTVENDFGVLDFANSTVAKNGDELTVTFAVTPKASFTGARKLWGSVKDTGSLQTAFVPLATWTVNASATLRVRPAANTPSANGS